MKYTWPAMIGSVFFITTQTFLVRVGLEKGKRHQGGFVSVGYITNRILDVLDDVEIH